MKRSLESILDQKRFLPDKYMRAGLYAEMMNLRQAKLCFYVLEKGDVDERIEDIRDQLALAYCEVRRWPDEEHFKKWDELIAHVDKVFEEMNVGGINGSDSKE